MRRLIMLRPLALLALVAGSVTACERDSVPAWLRRSARSDSASGTTVTSLISEADSMYWRGAYDSASVALRKALDRATTVGDTLAEPRILTWLGLAAYRQGNLGEARTHVERAVALALARGLGAELARSYNALGLVARDGGRLTDAEALFQKSARAAESHRDSAGIARAEVNLGLVYTEYVDFSRARQSYQRARVIGQRIGEARTEANALANIGALDIRVGRPQAALASLREARRIYARIEYTTGEQNALGQLGTLYAAIGEPTHALAALDSALGLARDQGMRLEEVIALELIGNVYASVGDATRALRFYSDALAIATELGLDAQVATIRRSEGATYAQMGNTRLARASTEAALSAHRKSGAPLEQLDDVLLLAEIAARNRDETESDSLLTEARRIARLIPTNSAQVLVSVTKARIADRAGRHRAVIQSLSGADVKSADADASIRWEVETLRARAYRKVARYDSAVVVGRRAIAEVERVRANLQPGPLRTTFVAERTLVYADLALSLLRVGRVEEAFEVASAARGRALIEHVATASREAAVAPLRDLLSAEELLRRIDELLSQIKDMESKSDAERGQPSALRRDLAQRIASARSEYETLLLRIARDHPGKSGLLSVRAVPTAEILATLRPGELLVQYMLTPEALLIFVGNSSGVRALTRPVNSSDLVNQVRIARDLFSQRDSDPAATTRVAGRLYESLIAPLRDGGLLDSARQLVIVPHDALAYLPFASLSDPATGRLLADDHALMLLPSATALPVLRSRVTSASRTTAGRQGGFVLAPFPRRLPATEREARAVVRALPNSVARVGDQATEIALRAALEDDGPVHVATHGVMNARNPMFSRIELARVTTTERLDDDGRLEVHELLLMSVKAPLVFLSGCETGAGNAWSTEFVLGEDYATLAQAFLYAGARDVIATLWRIDDEGAAAFAELFYRHLSTHPPADAISAAQRDMRRHPKFSHPYYWAGYTLTGGNFAVAQYAQ